MVLLKTSHGSAEVEIVRGHYQDGKLAVQLEERGELYATVSANVPIPLADGEFAFKNYSENEGFLEQLIAAGLVVETGRWVQSGFVHMPICRLTQNASPTGPRLEADKAGWPRCIECREEYEALCEDAAWESSSPAQP